MSFIHAPTSASRWVSLTPLIDVVFILIMFFMLTTQFDRTQVLELIVPSENLSSTQVFSDDDIARVLIKQDGAWQLNGVSYSFDDKSAIENLADFDRIFISADDGVVLQDVIGLIDKFADATVEKVSWIPTTNADSR